MSYQSFIPDDDQEFEREYQRFFQSRSETIKTIDKLKSVDVLVVGGGIHGAAFARRSALAGFKTLLLEQNDYASGTSSRSSKIAHGGVRYLEMFDFKQVFAGIKSREDLFKTASHLVRPYEFVIPLQKKQWWLRFKLGVGLKLYDLLARVSKRKRLWVTREQIQDLGFPADSELIGGWKYYDGLMNDTRLVIENIIAARQEGALCLNHARVTSINHTQTNSVEVGWQNNLDGKIHSISSGVVINCAGPWVAGAGRVKPGPLAANLRFSRGSHLVFDKKWDGPALLIPLAEKGRYYFVWPYLDKTFVGTTEREIQDLSVDPIPSEDEIEEILTRLRKDLPQSGLDRNSLYYCYAGIRTLYQKYPGKKISEVSRSHNWSYSNGVLSLSGGKFTTAYWTVEEGMQHLASISDAPISKQSLDDRKLPGAGSQDYIEEFKTKATELKLSEKIIQRIVSHFGANVKYFLQAEEMFELIGGEILRGEIEIAIDIEQAETLEDIVRRRLDLEYLPGYGLNLINQIAEILKEKRPATDIDQQLIEYRARIDKLTKLMNLGNN
ncbi:MAG: glycerol-3-phosphate dehydrogenase/oxidase [Bdellovibrionota bacterium]